MSASTGPRASSWEPPTPDPDADERFAGYRASMVWQQVEARGVNDSVVLDAMRVVPRHRFVPPQFEKDAYDDSPLPIGHGQTISQPYIVAVMTAALQLRPRDRVLEIGAGSGYQAAVLAEIVDEVCTFEIVEALANSAQSTLSALGYRNIIVKFGDGYRGWPEKAPFDAIILAAAPNHIPQPLIDQLAVGGRMILPLGDEDQNLVLLVKGPDGLKQRTLISVRFVPMTGEAEIAQPPSSSTL